MSQSTITNIIKDIHADAAQSIKKKSPQLNKENEKNFQDHLKDSLISVNKHQLTADQMAADLSSGKSENIHETMLAISHAQLNFNLMVQVRNKALEAYQEVMRMPV